MTSHVEIHHERMRQALSTAAGQWGNNIGRMIVNRAKARAPVDEGRLRSSISHTVTMRPNGVDIRVGSPLEYARYVHEGTGIYGPKRKKIVPISAKALKFGTPKMIGPLPAGMKTPAKGKRGFVFAKSVKGSPPNPFLTDALKNVFGTSNVHVNPS